MKRFFLCLLVFLGLLPAHSPLAAPGASPEAGKADRLVEISISHSHMTANGCWSFSLHRKKGEVVLNGRYIGARKGNVYIEDNAPKALVQELESLVAKQGVHDWTVAPEIKVNLGVQVLDAPSSSLSVHFADGKEVELHGKHAAVDRKAAFRLWKEVADVFIRHLAPDEDLVR